MKVARAERWTGSPRVARTVVRARKRLDLSQAQLADRCEVTPGTVAGWETGRHGIAANRVSRVAEVLEVPVAELVV